MMDAAARRWLIGGAVGFAVLAALGLGVRVNISDSLPTGIYVLSGPAKKGEVVSACVKLPVGVPVALTACGEGGTRVIKRYLAGPGDVVEFVKEGVRVNGVPVPESAARNTLRDGRPAHPLLGTHRLASDEVWLHGTAPHSYDSRYFGPVHQSNLGVGSYTLVWRF